jgi:hypothetical protein
MNRARKTAGAVAAARGKLAKGDHLKNGRMGEGQVDSWGVNSCNDGS